MTKIVEVDIDLTPDDIVNYLINADSSAQSYILRKLSNVHYNNTGKFLIQLRAVVEDIKDAYNHDIRNNIKNMIRDINDHIEEVENEKNELFETENAKYLAALDTITNRDVEEFENEGKIPAVLSTIVTMGSDMRFYFKKIPNKTPSTGGFVFDDIQYDYIDRNEQ